VLRTCGGLRIDIGHGLNRKFITSLALRLDRRWFRLYAASRAERHLDMQAEARVDRAYSPRNFDLEPETPADGRGWDNAAPLALF